MDIVSHKLSYFKYVDNYNPCKAFQISNNLVETTTPSILV